MAAARGHTVIASAPTTALLTDIPDNASLKLRLDICDHESIAQALLQIDQAGMQLTCLVNNAGVAPRVRERGPNSGLPLTKKLSRGRLIPVMREGSASLLSFGKRRLSPTSSNA